MTRASVLIGALALAVTAAPAQARMSLPVLFGGDLLDQGLGGSISFVAQSNGEPPGAMFERMFREFSTAAERLPRTRPRSDMEATLQAMEDGHVGFGASKPSTRVRGRPARRPRIKS